MNEPNESTTQALRQQLAQAIEAKAQADARLAQQRGVHERASALVVASEVEVRQLADSMQRHADEEALAVAEQLRLGESTTLGEVPAVVISQRQSAEQRLAVAVRARDQLSREAQEMEEALSVAESALHECACTVLSLEADGLAQEIDRGEKTLFALRTKLRGLGLASWGLARSAGREWHRPALLSPRALQAIHRPEDPQFAGGHDPAKDEAQRWLAFHAALRQDAAALKE
jgi:hypothetical protein